jgi:uncharacterized heparinase superfamily protein
VVPSVAHPLDSDVAARARDGIFRQLDRDVSVGYVQPDWRLGPVAADRLGAITLHYHEWAYALAAVVARGGSDAVAANTLLSHYIDDWIARCPVDAPGARSLAWNSYAIATRITWWIKTDLRLRAAAVLGPPWNDAALRSLWVQAKYLRSHFEWDLRANHLLRDAVGLAWAGRFFDGSQPDEWLRFATRVGMGQVREQVLPDGGHFERSPMYHLHAMGDVLSLACLVDDSAAAAECRSVWRRMAEYVAWVRHPDGGIPLLNDAALNGADDPTEALLAGSVIGESVDPSPRQGGRYFPDTGLVVWHGRPWSVFFDVGPVGPNEQPGHAHADSLTFECSYNGRRLVVDPGTFAYDHDDTRRYDRSTDSHNTVGLDGANSSEVWHIFRVGRRAKPTGVSVDIARGKLSATAGHTGYDHLPGRPRHTRTVTVRDDGPIEVTDRVAGSHPHRLAAGLLLAPDWTARPTATGWELSAGEDRVRVHVRGPDGLTRSVVASPYHSGFGTDRPTTRLTWGVQAPLPIDTVVSIEPVSTVGTL